jgi:NAD-dependent SIR2 family protein deacetylase
MDLAASAAQAAAALRASKGIAILAGAGMGVDSGLPDFRGDEGFWNAYPPYRALGVSFEEMANPASFDSDPAFGWGFYGHRLNLYRATVPHEGFAILLRWIRDLKLDSFVITSNVDGAFQKAGFSPGRIEEIHGTIHVLQCSEHCTADLWKNDEEVPVDLATMRAQRVPLCPRCGATARPNILMFDDGRWLPDRSAAQRVRSQAWQASLGDKPLFVVELGAGTAIPSIRNATRRLAQRPGATAVRINPRESEIAAPHLSLATGALAGLRAIDAALQAGG